MGRLAVVIPYWYDRPPNEALDIARQADRLGFPELWIGELRTFDAVAALGAIGQLTNTIDLALGPLPVGTRDPVSLALAAGTIAVNSGRRVTLAIGSSTPTVVESWHGKTWSRNVKRVTDTVAIVRQVMDARPTDYRGETAASVGFRWSLEPQQIDVAIAAFGPKMLACAAALADRVVFNLMTVPQAEAAIGVVRSTAEQLGRVPPPATLWLPTALEPGQEGWAQLRSQMAGYLAAPGYGEMFIDAGFGEIVELARSGRPYREVIASVTDELPAAIGAIGSIDDVKRRIADYHNAGVETVGIVPGTASDPAGSRVLTALA